MTPASLTPPSPDATMLVRSPTAQDTPEFTMTPSASPRPETLGDLERLLADIEDGEGSVRLGKRSRHVLTALVTAPQQAAVSSISELAERLSVSPPRYLAWPSAWGSMASPACRASFVATSPKARASTAIRSPACWTVMATTAVMPGCPAWDARRAPISAIWWRKSMK